MQPLQGKNWFLLASQPQGGASLTLGYYMQPPRGKNPNHGYSFAGWATNIFSGRKKITIPVGFPLNIPSMPYQLFG
jgi:hypothetical protein